MERGTRIERPHGASKPDLPPPLMAEKKRKLPPPIPEGARKAPPPPPRKKGVDVLSKTHLAPDVLAKTHLAPESARAEAEPEIDVEVEIEKGTVPPPARERGTAAREAKETKLKGPIFEAASNVPSKRGTAGVAVNPDTGTFIFAAGEQAEPTVVEGIIDTALERLGEGAEKKQKAVSMVHGETSRDRASSIDTRLMSAATRGALDAVVRENAHMLARGDKTSTVEVPPFVVGQVFNEEITPQEFYGDTRATEDAIGALVDKGTRGLAEQELASVQAVQDAETRLKAVRSQVREWLGEDPLGRWPTKSALEGDSSVNPEQRAYIAKVYEAEDALAAIGPTHKQLENNIQIAKILARKIEETRRRRLTETDEEFEDTYRALKDDPELAQLATENLPILLKRLKAPISLSPETARQHAAPELDAATKEHVDEAAVILNGLFADYRAAKDDAGEARALQNVDIALRSDRMQQVMRNPKARLALYQAVAEKFPASDRTLEILFRIDAKAIPLPKLMDLQNETMSDEEKKEEESKAREITERLIEPALSPEEKSVVDDITYEMRRASENPMQLLKDARFTSLSREGRFVVVERLKNLGVVKPEQTTDLLQARRLMLRGKPGEALTVFKVGRDGKVTKIATAARKEKSSEELSVGQQDAETKQILSTTKRKIEQQADVAVDIGVQVGDQIVVVPSSAEEIVMGQPERTGTEGIEKMLAELKDDPNRSAKTNSDRIGRPHLVLRIPE